jgi:hypothetical protein
MNESSQNPRFLNRRTMLRSMLVAAVAVPLAACTVTEDPLAKQARSGDNKNYIAGDGAVEEYSVEKRTEPIEINSKTYQGTPLTSARCAANRWSSTFGTPRAPRAASRRHI